MVRGINFVFSERFSNVKKDHTARKFQPQSNILLLRIAIIYNTDESIKVKINNIIKDLSEKSPYTAKTISNTF